MCFFILSMRTHRVVNTNRKDQSYKLVFRDDLDRIIPQIRNKEKHSSANYYYRDNS